MNKRMQEAYATKAKVIRAVAHPIRLAVLDLLTNGEQCVCDIVAHVGAERSNVSRHLAVMLRAGVLDSRKEGLRVMYSLRTPCLAECLDCAARAIAQNMKGRRTAGRSA